MRRYTSPLPGCEWSNSQVSELVLVPEGVFDVKYEPRATGWNPLFRKTEEEKPPNGKILNFSSGEFFYFEDCFEEYCYRYGLYYV